MNIPKRKRSGKTTVTAKEKEKRETEKIYKINKSKKTKTKKNILFPSPLHSWLILHLNQTFICEMPHFASSHLQD